MINWAEMKTTKEELETILAIAKRALPASSRLTLIMDLEACHSMACPLNLEALLAADDGNFAHDVDGISRHIDRNTGNLTGCFVPRFALR